MSVEFAAYDPAPASRPAPFAGSVRRASIADADAITAISVARNGGDAAETRSRVQTELEPERDGTRSAVFVAEDRRRVVAFSRVRRAEAFDDVEPELRPPTGWYLLGIVVVPAERRRGIGRALTRARLDWLAERTHECFYFVRATNRASIDLHAPFGFVVHMRRFRYPRTGLEPGEGVLLRAAL